MRTAARLYERHRLRRVYFTAHSPIPGQESLFAGAPTPLVREHRLYQADHLVRQYGFSLDEVLEQPWLDLRLDPKLAWALRHPEQWPVDVRTASREELLRVPGFGRRTVRRLLRARRHGAIRWEDLVRMGARTRVARHFVCTADARPSRGAGRLHAAHFAPAAQLSLPLGA